MQLCWTTKFRGIITILKNVTSFLKYPIVFSSSWIIIRYVQIPNQIKPNIYGPILSSFWLRNHHNNSGTCRWNILYKYNITRPSSRTCLSHIFVKCAIDQHDFYDLRHKRRSYVISTYIFHNSKKNSLCNYYKNYINSLKIGMEK